MSALRRIKYGLGTLGFIVLGGTAGFVVIEDAPVFDSLYMVLITITTVGFAEVFPLSTLGRVWTTVVMISGFGVALYTAFASFEYLVDLGEVRRRKLMQTQIGELRDHVILCGWGRVGRGTWNALESMKVDVAVIESDPDRADAAEAAGALAIRGDATHNDVLELAGIHAAQSLIACVADDSDNLVIALSAKALRAELRVVCRATDLESDRKFRLAGADAVVAPQAVGAERLALMAMQPELAQIFDIVVAGSPVEFHVEELDVEPDSGVAGKTIRDSNIRQDTGALILAVEGQKERILINPGPDLRLGVGDRMVVVGTRDQVEKAAAMLKTAAEFSTGRH